MRTISSIAGTEVYYPLKTNGERTYGRKYISSENTDFLRNKITKLGQNTLTTAGDA